MAQPHGQLGSKKNNRRSVLNSARKTYSDVDDRNNYELAEILAKTRVRLGNIEKEKFGYVAQNLKFMEANTFLKNEVKTLRSELSLSHNVQKAQKALIFELEEKLAKIQEIAKTEKLRLGGLPEAVFSPTSLESSFDSGVNSSTSSSDNVVQTNQEIPKIPELVYSVEDNSEFHVPLPEEVMDGPPDTIPDDWFTTPRIPKSNTRPVVKRELVNKTNVSVKQPRRTPSRASKSAISSLAEPSVASKLRQGDKFTDNFSMTYTAKKCKSDQ